GGERNGIEGIAVGIGIVGIEGMLGSGGKLTLGRVLGIVGRLGSGGSVGLGREGCAVGNVGCGSVGIEGIGGNVGLGKLGTAGTRFTTLELSAIMSPPAAVSSVQSSNSFSRPRSSVVSSLGLDLCVDLSNYIAPRQSSFVQTFAPLAQL
ncbi:hypothetical protein H0E87_028517, partial [Populus deltoides]